jgi:hypothetical protein
MASPSPGPLARIRWVPSRWNGWKRPSISSGGMSGPVLLTVRTARPSVMAVEMSIRPPSTLCRMALPSRFATRLSARAGSPVAGAAERAASMRMPLRSASWCRSSMAFAARSKGSQCSIPRSLLARVSSPSMRRSCCWFHCSAFSRRAGVVPGMSLDRLSLRALVNQRLAMSLSMTSMLDEALADLLGLGAPDSEADGLYLACPLIPRLPSSRRTDRRISPLGHVPGQSLSEVGDCPPMLARSAGSRVLRQAFSPAPGRQRAVRRVPVADCRQRRKRLGGHAGQQGAASRGVGGSRPPRLGGVREFSRAAPDVDRSLARKLAA